MEVFFKTIIRYKTLLLPYNVKTVCKFLANTCCKFRSFYIIRNSVLDKFVCNGQINFIFYNQISFKSKEEITLDDLR